MKHQHPIKILKLTTKYFWLLLIPLVRGLIALRGDVYTWALGAWMDILVIFLILGAAYLRWYFIWYEVNASCIHFKKGIFLKSDVSIPFTSVCAVSAERKFFFRPIKAVNIFLDTNSSNNKKADVQITLGVNEYENLFAQLSSHKTAGFIKTSYRPSRANLAIFSFLFSSTLSGVILLATLLIQSSKIIGNSLQQSLITAVTDISDKIALGLPPIAIAISLAVFAGWLYSFFSNLLRYFAFEIVRVNKTIHIHTGYFTKRNYYIYSDKINYVDLHQNLLTKLFSIMSVHVNCAGYGKAKNEIPVFVPITTKSQVYTSLQLLLPDMYVIEGGLKPRSSYFFRFIWVPFFASAGIFVLTFMLYRRLPLWSNMILFVSIMIEIPLLWLIAAKFVNFLTSRICYNDNNICLKYADGYIFHTIIVPKNKLAKVTVTQSFIQVISKSCDVKFYTNSEFTKYHNVISMPLDDVLQFLKNSGLSDISTGFFKK